MPRDGRRVEGAIADESTVERLERAAATDGRATRPQPPCSRGEGRTARGTHTGEPPTQGGEGRVAPAAEGAAETWRRGGDGGDGRATGGGCERTRGEPTAQCSEASERADAPVPAPLVELGERDDPRRDFGGTFDGGTARSPQQRVPQQR